MMWKQACGRALTLDSLSGGVRNASARPRGCRDVVRRRQTHSFHGCRSPQRLSQVVPSPIPGNKASAHGPPPYPFFLPQRLQHDLVAGGGWIDTASRRKQDVQFTSSLNDRGWGAGSVAAVTSPLSPDVPRTRAGLRPLCSVTCRMPNVLYACALLHQIPWRNLK